MRRKAQAAGERHKPLPFRLSPTYQGVGEQPHTCNWPVAKRRPLLAGQKTLAHVGTMDPFVMIDPFAAVLGLASAGIFLAHAIESYRAHGLVGAEARFTSFKQGLFRRVQ